ncbi:MAG: hypothetical protein Q9163_001895 [Psora crenata]
MHRGFCVNYSATLGPLQGPMRFEATVNLDIIRFLGWEQLLKNAYLHRDSIIAEIGVSNEILEQCQSSLHDGQHPPISGEPAITFTEASAVSLSSQDGLQGQIVTISGSGKLAIATAFRLLEVGAKIVSLSDRNGSILCPAGLTIDQINAVKVGKSNQASLASIMRPMVATGEMTYYPRERPWQHVQRATIALPCAVEEEIELADAVALVGRGVEFVLEGSTMSCSQAAVEFFKRPRSQGLPKVWYAPSEITTAAGLDACIEKDCPERNPHDWHKNQWIQRVEEATETNASNVITSLREYTEGFDIRTSDFNLGSSVLATPDCKNVGGCADTGFGGEDYVETWTLEFSGLDGKEE